MENLKEQWLPIAESMGRYAVSNLGRVRRIKPGRGTQNGRTLKPSINKQGYPVVGIVGKTRLVHRLVAIAFLGDPPPAHEVNHIDGNTTNNLISNLEWVTKSENAKHAFRIGLHVPRPVRGERHGKTTITADQVKSIRAAYINGQNTKELGAIFGLHPASVWRIATGRTWGHVV